MLNVKNTLNNHVMFNVKRNKSDVTLGYLDHYTEQNS